jgi:hypothetical protein
VPEETHLDNMRTGEILGVEGYRSRKFLSKSNHDPLDLIEAELVAPAVVELRRARRGVVRHRRGLFERSGSERVN